MHKDCKVRQELYRANQYEKPWQDAGVFYCLDWIIPENPHLLILGKLNLSIHTRYLVHILE